MGGGTTLVEAKLLGRNSIGVDINPESIKRCQEKTDFDYPESGGVSIRLGDAQKLSFIEDETIDFICTHPPYANIIQYSDGLDNDLSLLDMKVFLEKMHFVACESLRVLKSGKFCAILVGDMRKKGSVIPLGFSVMDVFQESGFKLKEIILKEQHNCKATGYWKTNSIKYNFLLLAHEYLFVFKKDT